MFGLAAVSGVYSGPVKYGNIKLASIHSFGPVSLKRTQITGHTQVMGVFEAYRARINSLTVHGTADIKWTRISGASDINGTLHAAHSVFKQTLTTHSQDTHLSHTKTKDIIVGAPGVLAPTQCVHVLNHSQVDGSISFRQSGGIVKVDGTSKVTGKVVGGTIKKC